VSAPLLESDGSCEGAGGVRLHYRGWEPPDARAALLVVHGLGEHAGRYAGFATALAGRGYACFAPDLRGHGSSEGRRGHVPAFDAFLLDLDRVRREVQALLPPGTPLILAGQELGGLIALRYLEEFDPPVRGGIISAPWLSDALRVPRWQVAVANTLSRVLPALPLRARRPAGTGADDPLLHQRITPRLFTELASAMGLALQRSDRLALPLLFLLPGADEAADGGRAAAFATALRGETIVRTFWGSRQDVLGGMERGGVLETVVEWLGQFQRDG
jgi:alpha-beta hydrolase superfamily lysophospholipase